MGYDPPKSFSHVPGMHIATSRPHGTTGLLSAIDKSPALSNVNHKHAERPRTTVSCFMFHTHSSSTYDGMHTSYFAGDSTRHFLFLSFFSFRFSLYQVLSTLYVLSTAASLGCTKCISYMGRRLCFSVQQMAYGIGIVYSPMICTRTYPYVYTYNTYFVYV